MTVPQKYFRLRVILILVDFSAHFRYSDPLSSSNEQNTDSTLMVAPLMAAPWNRSRSKFPAGPSLVEHTLRRLSDSIHKVTNKNL